MADAELVKMQGHKNEWFVRTARRILQERAAEGQVGERRRRKELAKLLDEPAGNHHLPAIWALHVTGGVDPTITADLLNVNRSTEDELRAWAIRLAFETQASQQTLENPILLGTWNYRVS